jgi:hypothetical protein
MAIAWMVMRREGKEKRKGKRKKLKLNKNKETGGFKYNSPDNNKKKNNKTKLGSSRAVELHARTTLLAYNGV